MGYLIGFVDILGFKEILKKKSPKKILDEIYYFTSKTFEEFKNIEVAIFYGDTFLLAQKSLVDRKKISNFLINLALIQGYFMSYSQNLVRGSFTYGELILHNLAYWVNEPLRMRGINIFLGEGLTKAVHLEQSPCPLIKIDKELLCSIDRKDIFLFPYQGEMYLDLISHWECCFEYEGLAIVEGFNTDYMKLYSILKENLRNLRKNENLRYKAKCIETYLTFLEKERKIKF